MFLACDPLARWRHVKVAEPRTMQDFAHQMLWLVDEAYPDASVVWLVLDNPNTHRAASLYETFPAAEARHIPQRLEFHYTPKHSSWLPAAEARQYGGDRVQHFLPQLPPAENPRRGISPPGSPRPGSGAK